MSIQDSSLMISLIDIPTNRDEETYKKHFNKIFKNYKDKLAKSNQNQNFENKKRVKSLYKPHYYNLWGSHDICIISLVDGYTFAHRLFHQNTYKNIENSKDKKVSEKNVIDVEKFNFNYQIISGIVPPDSISLYEKYELIDNSKLYPFISITKIKVNNGFLIGNGISYLDAIVKLIDKIVKSKNNLEFLIVESFCYNELTLVLFSQKIDTLYKTIIELRENDLETLKDVDIEAYEKIKENSLLNIFYDNIEKDKFSEHHLFAGTHTYFGYNPDLVKDVEIDSSSNIVFNLKWIVKPGHIATLKKKLQSEGKLNEEIIKTEIGKSVLNFNKEFKTLKEVYDFHNTFKEIDNHIDKVDTIILFPEEEFDKEISHKVSINNVLKETNPFNQKIINEIRINLRKSHVSKLLTERVIKMYNNYSTCVEDPYLFSYFIGFKDFLKYVYNDIKNFADENSKVKSLNEFHQILRYYIESFDKAFNNLFINSNHMIDVADFKLDHNGGLHRLHAIYDFAYKEFQKFFKNDSATGFVFIDGHQTTKSTRHSFRLNYSHIFNPEIFITVCIKEAANFYLSRLGVDLEHKDINKLNNIEILKLYTSDNNQLGSIVKEEKEGDVVFNFLKSCLDKEFAKYMFEDLIMFRILFRSDEKLFSYWFWMIIMQTTDSYEKTNIKEHQIKDSIFIKALLRLFVLYNLTENKNVIEKIKFIPPCHFLNDLWNKYFVSTEYFVEMFINSDSITKYKEEMEIQISHFFVNMMMNFTSKDLIKGKDNNFTFILESYKTGNIKQKEAILTLLTNPNTQIGICESNFLLNLFYKYLSDLKNKNNNKNPILSRNESGDSMIETKELQHELFGAFLVDSYGGIYIHGFENRKEYFILKTKLLRDLWNYTLINKRKQFNEYKEKI